MARIRTIKPDLYRHELLQELEEKHPELRPMLVFTGLMTQADREGRFRWNPRILKLDILPFVTFDLSCSMSLLAEHGFLLRYEAPGGPYGVFPAWAKHQVVNNKERLSELPAPPQERDVDVTGTRAARVEHATSTPLNPSRGEGEEEGEVGKGTTRGDTPSKTDLSLFSRILCEKTGIFGTRDQAEVHDCFRVFVQKSGMSLGDAVNHMAGRWGEYQKRASELAWTYGGPHKFFTKGQWNQPEVWPRRSDGNSSGIDGAEREALSILAGRTAGDPGTEADGETGR